MSRPCVWFVASVCACLIGTSPSVAQDGRGSRGGGWYRNSGTTTRAVPVVVPVAPVVVQPPAVQAPAAPVGAIALTVVPTPSLAGISAAAAPTVARVSVKAPDGAQVWFDGTPGEVKDGVRTFTSGPIDAGQTSRVTVRIAVGGISREVQLALQTGDVMTIDVRGP
jgi:hypothetical protein